MEYSSGEKGMRFDIIRLERNHLRDLYDDKTKHYGALKDRIKQTLPTIAEVRTKVDGTHEVFESSALPPFAFTNRAVTYMTESDIGGTGTRKNPLKMGFAFFQLMFNSLKKDATPLLPDLPPVMYGELMTKTSVLRSVPPPEQQQPQDSAAAGDCGCDDDDDDNEEEEEEEVHFSDDEADEAAGESPRPARVTCGECGSAFISEAFLALHAGKKTCRPINSNS